MTSKDKRIREAFKFENKMRLKSFIAEELQKAYQRVVSDGQK